MTWGDSEQLTMMELGILAGIALGLGGMMWAFLAERFLLLH